MLQMLQLFLDAQSKILENGKLILDRGGGISAEASEMVAFKWSQRNKEGWETGTWSMAQDHLF